MFMHNMHNFLDTETATETMRGAVWEVEDFGEVFIKTFLCLLVFSDLYLLPN